MRTTLIALAVVVPGHVCLAQYEGQDHAIGTYAITPASFHTDPAFTAIQLTLDSMEAAVLQGNQNAYLAHVAADDPVFLTEQRNWAKDLDKHIPEVFHLDFKPDTRTDAWAEGDLTMKWAMPGADVREVSYRVGFSQGPDANWLYAGEIWDQVPAEGAIALCAPGLDEVGRAAVEVYPDVHAHVEEGFEINLDTVQQIKIYGSMRHLQASIYLSYVDPLSGWNEPHESIKILSRRKPNAGNLKVLLAHELGHVATFAMGEQAPQMPWWTLEGVAELAAERFSGDTSYVNSLVRDWAAAGNLAPWQEMADFRETPKQWMMHVYKQSQHLMGYISDRFGRSARNNWIRAMAQGATLEDATQTALGITFAQLDQNWRASIEPAK